MNERRLPRRLGAGLLSLSMLLVACSAAAAPSTSPPASARPDAPVTAPPSDGSSGGTDPGNVGSDKLVVAKPGQLDVHDVQADALAARVDGSTIILTITWTSGVEPCNVLDQVAVVEGALSYAITLREGHGPEEVVCIAIAETHKTKISILTDGPGTYVITDSTGGAAAIEVTVS